MVTKEELARFFAEAFPQNDLIIETVGNKSATLRKNITKTDLRPGHTVSGPTLMALADAALYAAILGELGLVALPVRCQAYLSRGGFCNDSKCLQQPNSLIIA